MVYRYRDDVTRLRIRDAVRVGAAVTFLAFIAGTFLSAWLSVPPWLAIPASLALLGGWVSRHHRRRLQRLRNTRFHLDDRQLSVALENEIHPVISREHVRDMTFDADEVIAIYDHRAEPAFRIGLRLVQDGPTFWESIREWGPVREVPRGRFSVPESMGALVAMSPFVALVLYLEDALGVIGGGLAILAVFMWHMRIAWRHRHVSVAARRIVWVAMGLGTVVTARIMFLALSAWRAL